MKIFLYKLVISLFGIFLLYEFTIGYKIKYYERNLKILITKEYADTVKEKLKKEMKTAINKENYLNPDDARLIAVFLKKIQKELNSVDIE